MTERNKGMFRQREFGSAHERETQQEYEREQKRNPCCKSLLSGRGVETGVLSGRERSASFAALMYTSA